MIPRVHRPVICAVCKSEMPPDPGQGGWFHCLICGTEREE